MASCKNHLSPYVADCAWHTVRSASCHAFQALFCMLVSMQHPQSTQVWTGGGMLPDAARLGEGSEGGSLALAMPALSRA